MSQSPDNYPNLVLPAGPPPKPPRKPCSRCGCTTIAALFILIGFILYSARQEIHSRLTPAEISEIHDFEAKIITLSPDWHRPASLPKAEVLEFLDIFTSDTNRILAKHNNLLQGEKNSITTAALLMQLDDGGSTVYDDQRNSYDAMLADLQPLIKLSSNSVTMANYTVDTFAWSETPMIQLLAIQTFAKLLAIVSRDEAARGNFGKAIDLAILPIRLVKRPEQASTKSHIIATAVTSISCKALDQIAGQCSDVFALERGASVMKELRSVAFPGELTNLEYIDTIAMLRVAAANGYPVNLAPQTMAGYYHQAKPMYTAKYPQWIIDNLPPNDRRVMAAKSRLSALDSVDTPSNSKFGALMHNRRMSKLAKFLFRFDPNAVQYIRLKTNFDEVETRARIALTMYDLTQMHFARRIAELKGEPNPAALPDPFSSGTLQFSETRKAYFSVGPDKVDDKGALQYDATNGTLSPGDIFVQRAH